MQSSYARRARVCKAGSLGGARTHRRGLATIQATTTMGSPVHGYTRRGLRRIACLPFSSEVASKAGPALSRPTPPLPPISQQPGARARAVRSGGAILSDHQPTMRQTRSRWGVRCHAAPCGSPTCCTSAVARVGAPRACRRCPGQRWRHCWLRAAPVCRGGRSSMSGRGSFSRRSVHAEIFKPKGCGFLPQVPRAGG